MRIKNNLKKILCAGLAIVMTASTAVTAFADEPYKSYTYDAWEDAIPSQNAYRIERTVNGVQMKLDRLRDKDDPLFVDAKAPTNIANAQDLYFDSIGHDFWLCDTDNNRILRLNAALEIIGCYTGVKGKSEAVKAGENGETEFNKPMGIYVGRPVNSEQVYVYIADSDNERVVKAKIDSPREMSLVKEYTKPKSELYSSKSFVPSKVIADSSENVYAICKTENKGSVQFDKNGEFQGFYGANRVPVTAAVIAQKLWRKVASKEQVAGMKRSVPTEYVNFDVDDEGFIYTVTEAGDTTTDAVKKLNSAGYNIWDNEAHDKLVYGDYDLKTQTEKVTASTKLTDIVISENGLINILDFGTGHIFQYDRDSNLLCIFGTKRGINDARGTLSAPNAIEAYKDNIYVLDGTKNDITVFALTTFGEKMHQAVELFDQGRYLEAKPYWEDVMARDGGYPMAYVGLGKAALKEEKYSEALEYFKNAYQQDDYDKAFKYARDEYIKDHFTAIIIILLVLIVWAVTVAQMHKRGKYIIKKKKNGKGANK